MIQRIKSVETLPDHVLSVVFDDGCRVLYDLKEDFSLPGYDSLRTIEGLFAQARLDESRTCVFWNDEIDLPSDIIREYGKVVL